MTTSDIKTLRMICNNCNLPNAWNDLLNDIIKREEKFVWHDLTTNINDLPKDGERVLFVSSDDGSYTGEYNSCSLDRGWFSNDDGEAWNSKGTYDVDKYEVVKWRYIDD